MDRLEHKIINKNLRKARIRASVVGTKQRPRLSINISNMHISAQIIDDEAHKTIVAVTTVGKKSVGDTMTEKATFAGGEIAKKAKKAKLKKVVFDRSGHKYHGRVKAFADSARSEGLEF